MENAGDIIVLTAFICLIIIIPDIITRYRYNYMQDYFCTCIPTSIPHVDIFSCL